MKHLIHTALSRTENRVSGEELSRLLNISRVAVWKHIQKMKEEGYPVESDHRGYRLDPWEDTLFPWAFPEYAERLRYYPVLESTMDKARELAEKGAPDGSVILSEEQTRGRGRLERIWDSRPGGLYFTLITRPVLPLSETEQFSRRILLALAETIISDYQIPVWLKPPNDIITSRGKIAGVLAEVSGEVDRIRYINLGIGVNIRNSPRVAEQPAASLEDLTGRSCRRRDFLQLFLTRLEPLLSCSPGEIRRRWLSGQNPASNKKENIS